MIKKGQHMLAFFLILIVKRVVYINIKGRGSQ